MDGVLSALNLEFINLPWGGAAFIFVPRVSIWGRLESCPQARTILRLQVLSARRIVGGSTAPTAVNSGGDAFDRI